MGDRRFSVGDRRPRQNSRQTREEPRRPPPRILSWVIDGQADKILGLREPRRRAKPKGEDRENSHFSRADALLRQNGGRAFRASRRDKNPFPPRADSLFGAAVAPAPDCDSGLSGLGFHAKSRQGNLKFMTAVHPRESLAVQREGDHYRKRCRAERAGRGDKPARRGCHSTVNE